MRSWRRGRRPSSYAAERDQINEGYARRGFLARFPDVGSIPTASTTRFSVSESEQLGDRLSVGRREHARLGDDRRDQLGRGDVEGEVQRRRVDRRDRHPLQLRDLPRIALLDRDLIARSAVARSIVDSGAAT